MARRGLLVIASWALALALASCERKPGSPDPLDEIRAALVSIEYYALRERPSLPPQVMPIPLDKAVGILRRDADNGPFGESRRRRSITALVVGGIDLNAPDIRIRDRQQIDVLLGADKEAFYRFLEGLPWRGMDLPTLAKRIQEFLDSGGPAIPGCVASNAMRVYPQKPKPSLCCRPDGDDTNVIWEQASVEVTRSDGLAGLAAALDPQNWDEKDQPTGKACNPFFVSAYAQDVNGQPATCPPSPGSDWWHPLYEQFQWSQNSTTSTLATILGIRVKFDAAAQKSRFDYCLNKSVFGQATYTDPYGTYVWRGSIDVDEGFQAIEQTAAGPFGVFAEKKLRFAGWKDAADNDVTPFVRASAELNLMAMHTALKEAVCCRPAPCP